MGITAPAIVAHRAHESAAGVAVISSKSVRQAQSKWIGSSCGVPAWIKGAYLLAAQGGHQLLEGRVWELVKKHLEAGVPPDLEADRRTTLEMLAGSPAPMSLQPG